MERAAEGQGLNIALWLDGIERSKLADGSIALLVDNEVIHGVTSNLIYLERAIRQGYCYDNAIQTMALGGMDAEQIFSRLLIEDLQMAADLLKPLYEASEGEAGYVSTGFNISLGLESERLIRDTRSLWTQVNRKNLMLMVPATEAGIPVIRRLISEGININATQIYSLERFIEVIDACLGGLEERSSRGEDVSGLRSVATLEFLSLDERLRPALAKREGETASPSQAESGETALAMARLATQTLEGFCNSERWVQLQANGAKMLSILWAESGAQKNTHEALGILKMLTAEGAAALISPDFFEVFLATKNEGLVDKREQAEANDHLTRLRQAGFDLQALSRDLLNESLEENAKAHIRVLETIDRKREGFVESLGNMAESVKAAIKTAAEEVMVGRLFDGDPSLWTEDRSQHEEIRNRLGWLDLPKRQLVCTSGWLQFRESCLNAGFTDVFVLGMGGSSLAPEVYSLTLAKDLPEGSGLNLQIIDTTNPDEIYWREASVDLMKTLFIVASKSGSTSETNAAFHYFWQRLIDLGEDHPGDHFIAITDPGTSLENMAKERHFMRIFEAPANVGGRYSAFTEFGMLPAALMGIDLEKMLHRAAEAQSSCSRLQPYAQNPGLVLGLTLAQAYKAGKSKLVFSADAVCKPFGPWLEQLIAESSGKDGKGMLPIESEPVIAAEAYTKDRIFVDMRVGDSKNEEIPKIIAAGHPVLEIKLNDVYDLAGQLYLWEYATAILCAAIGVNAFDQPNVQESKTNTKSVITAFQKTGQLEEGKPIWQGRGGSIYGQSKKGLENAESLQDALTAFLEPLAEGGYIAINAYLERTPEMEAKLASFRQKLAERYHYPTTLGFGPRFQHSTGQYHKGGLPGGKFIVLTQEPKNDLEIPEEGMSFGILQRAQALGDMEALVRNDRDVIRIHLDSISPAELA